jgi:hypothetical protein
VDSNWYVSSQGPVAVLAHAVADDEGPIWRGEVEIVRGAPSWDSHPELDHAIKGLMNASAHRDFVRHAWTYDLPDHYASQSNMGENRRYLLLTASGGALNWSLVLRLPRDTPQFVYAAICRGFHASLKGATSMKPHGPDQSVKSASLGKGSVPKPDAPPSPVKDGMSSIVAPKG